MPIPRYSLFVFFSLIAFAASGQTDGELVDWGPPRDFKVGVYYDFLDFRADGSYLLHQRDKKAGDLISYGTDHRVVGTAPGPSRGDDTKASVHLHIGQANWLGRFTQADGSQQTDFSAGRITEDGIEAMPTYGYRGDYSYKSMFVSRTAADSPPQVLADAAQNRFYLVNARMQQEKKEAETVEVGVYDLQFNEVWRRTLTLNFDDGEGYIVPGDVMMDSTTVVVAAVLPSAKKRDGPTLRLYQVGADEVRHTDLNFPEGVALRRWTMALDKADRSKLTVYGVYAESGKSRKVIGSFRTVLDRELVKIDQTITPFEDETLLESLRESSKAAILDGTGQGGFRGFDLLRLPNGHTWMLFEQCYYQPSGAQEASQRALGSQWYTTDAYIVRYDASGVMLGTLLLEKEYPSPSASAGYYAAIANDRVFLLYNDTEHRKLAKALDKYGGPRTAIQVLDFTGKQLDRFYLHPEPKRGKRIELGNILRQGDRLLLRGYNKNDMYFGTLNLLSLPAR
ncbi:hypothetical protein LEM8419_02587 [Neolewinella maritima]|uniref:Uncharacterized protein n=1 Tax=Neolewinella maritima TaxID=1383882 RepID=A0ABM9B2W0_9BACT|nr:hypothetical protein [Neolewinella maritima]CAH1001681.1 hypothetical protein LEM8419_02587 [Neolewinella maritima]